MLGSLTSLLYFALIPALWWNDPDFRLVADGKGRAFYSDGEHISFDPSSAFSSVNIDLLAQIDLAAFSASSGNDCWGYVSPSGREYALVGLNNKVAFVEVTDPVNPNYFADIPHSSSTWADVKVYQDHCYVVTERSGSGIQVIDLSDIDNGNVTLVRTITSPGRSHNVAIDTTSGFLYTCGSRNGTGTTTCFDLTNPANPVQVGAGSMTGTYQHDVKPLTYTSGPFSGRQILFGNGEGRGIEIWDVTDKANPFLVKRQTYPNVGYSHQGWLSEDNQYWYVNDELDERSSGVLTRTLVFDVSDIANPTLVNTFTTGLPSIDHNLYVHDGFVYESNYTSGIRIFNINDDPINPNETGWFDTYPEDDSTNFRGTWSNYPYLPSGTLIVNDINRGLFVLDPSDALANNFNASNFQIIRGFRLSGNLNSLQAVDNDSLDVQAGITLSQNEAPIIVEFYSVAPSNNPPNLTLKLTGMANTPGLTRTVMMYDWDIEDFVTVMVSNGTTAFQSDEILLIDPARFIEPTVRLMKARVEVKQTGIALLWPWTYSFDQVGWRINP